MAAGNEHVSSHLLSLTYVADVLLGWRAVEALGLAPAQVAETDAEFVRNMLRRLAWSLNDELGSIGWRSPQAMGVIIAERPRQFAEFVPLVVSLFAPEKRHFTPSVLWAVGHQPNRCYCPHLFVVYGLIWLVLFGCTWNIVRGLVGLRDEIVALKHAQE